MTQPKDGSPIIYTQYKPTIISKLERRSSEDRPATGIFEPFTFPAKRGNSGKVTPVIEAFLQDQGFWLDWIAEFATVADEALSNAADHAPPGSMVEAILIIVQSGQDRFCSLVVDNQAPQAEQAPVAAAERTKLEERLLQTRGRGFDLMEHLADGLAVQIQPGCWIQTVLEKDALQ